MRKHQNGQALVEFVLLLPILILLFFGIFDFGRILYGKNHLESLVGDVINIFPQKLSTKEELEQFLNESSDIKLEVKFTYLEDGLLEIKVKEKLPLYTPGIGYIISDPYQIEVKRVVPYE